MSSSMTCDRSSSIPGNSIGFEVSTPGSGLIEEGKRVDGPASVDGSKEVGKSVSLSELGEKAGKKEEEGGGEGEDEKSSSIPLVDVDRGFRTMFGHMCVMSVCRTCSRIGTAIIRAQLIPQPQQGGGVRFSSSSW